MIRRHPADPGTITEFKTLEFETDETGRLLPKDNSRAAKDELRAGNGQLQPHGGGHVVIDGRAVGLSEPEARRAVARFLGERRKYAASIPERITLILADGRGLDWES